MYRKEIHYDAAVALTGYPKDLPVKNRLFMVILPIPSIEQSLTAMATVNTAYVIKADVVITWRDA